MFFIIEIKGKSEGVLSVAIQDNGKGIEAEKVEETGAE